MVAQRLSQRLRPLPPRYGLLLVPQGLRGASGLSRQVAPLRVEDEHLVGSRLVPAGVALGTAPIREQRVHVQFSEAVRVQQPPHRCPLLQIPHEIPKPWKDLGAKERVVAAIPVRCQRRLDEPEYIVEPGSLRSETFPLVLHQGGDRAGVDIAASLHRFAKR